MRDLIRRIRSQISSFEEDNRLITRSLGMKPRNGGSPPRENRLVNERALVFALGIELICLKWKTWLVLRRRATEDETME